MAAIVYILFDRCIIIIVIHLPVLNNDANILVEQDNNKFVFTVR